MARDRMLRSSFDVEEFANFGDHPFGVSQRVFVGQKLLKQRAGEKRGQFVKTSQQNFPLGRSGVDRLSGRSGVDVDGCRQIVDVARLESRRPIKQRLGQNFGGGL